VNLSVCNLHHESAAELTCVLRGGNAYSVNGRVLTAPAMNSMNTFEQPDAVKPAAFGGARWAEDRLTLSLPARSLVTLELT
jgi:alpha-N-arabinofuranosidase